MFRMVMLAILGSAQFRCDNRRNASNAIGQPETEMPIKIRRASVLPQTPDDIAAYLNAPIEETDDPRLLCR